MHWHIFEAQHIVQGFGDASAQHLKTQCHIFKISEESKLKAGNCIRNLKNSGARASFPCYLSYLYFE
jgi:hypothetical protein